ncbi:zinc metalloprotease [Desulfosoma caldarium]|uniref:Zn-dependent protease n=1 Tax=Desulfosoma caldarium TaxID=610254 RepID=A0A3N1VJK6_9BACT|nr:hypothetical protein [Desulfosoma caldarium]ROR02996.1 hypothetical protein EDC27_0251 [Desulfosoma caldarium]
MEARPLFPIPYVLHPAHLAVDDAVSFCVAVLVAVLVNAEGQAFAATLLGDKRPGAKDRLHFNAFLHLDVLGTLSFLATGMGWSKRIGVDTTKFKYPDLYLVLTRAAGPFANFLMANIFGSLAWLLRSLSLDPRVFLMVVAVNLTVAVYHLVPILPMATGTLVSVMLIPKGSRLEQSYHQLGPYLLLAVLLLDRLSEGEIVGRFLAPFVRDLFTLLTT